MKILDSDMFNHLKWNASEIAQIVEKRLRINFHRV